MTCPRLFARQFCAFIFGDITQFTKLLHLRYGEVVECTSSTEHSRVFWDLVWLARHKKASIDTIEWRSTIQLPFRQRRRYVVDRENQMVRKLGLSNAVLDEVCSCVYPKCSDVIPGGFLDWLDQNALGADQTSRCEVDN